jgi:putative tryptophan/tyrosine transport system permease protein
MNIVAFSGALELGFLYGLVALGIYISFRVLDFPDLTVDGSFPLGGAIAAALILKGVPPIVATLMAIVAGAIAGLCTATLNVKFKILNLLASILTMIALYSINLRIMGRPNLPLLNQPTVFQPITALLQALPEPIPTFGNTLLLGAIALSTKFIFDRFLQSEIGLAMRATGANPAMARAQGISTDGMVLLGMAIANGLVAFAGALFAQLNGGADVGMGIGTIIFGLAAVIGGETLFDKLTIWQATIGAIVGSILYRIVIAVALQADFLGIQAQDLNLVTAVLVAIALVLPKRFGKQGA